VFAMTHVPRVLAALALVTAVVQAQEPAPAKRVKVTLVVVLATEKGDKVDARVKCIADEVRKRDPQLTNFELHMMRSASLAVDQAEVFPIVEEATARVVVHRSADNQNKVELAVTAPRQGEIVYRTVCGKFLPIVTRYQTKNGERLILAIRVQPCNGK
jgi:hypothetical protein